MVRRFALKGSPRTRSSVLSAAMGMFALVPLTGHRQGLDGRSFSCGRHFWRSWRDRWWNAHRLGDRGWQSTVGENSRAGVPCRPRDQRTAWGCAVPYVRSATAADVRVVPGRDVRNIGGPSRAAGPVSRGTRRPERQTRELRLSDRIRQGDLADLLGATTSSIITILNAWRAAGFVLYDTDRAFLTCATARHYARSSGAEDGS